MSRKVLIEKIGETTVVRTWDISKPDVKRSYAYNKGADYNYDPKTQVLAIEDSSKVNPRLTVYFDELENNLGAANMEAYFDLLAENLFFLAKSSSSSSGPDYGIGSYIEVTTAALNDLITNSQLVIGQVYKVLNIHSIQNTRVKQIDGYFVALSPNQLAENGLAEFVEPNYDQAQILNRNATNGSTLVVGVYAWGNKVWDCNGTVTAIDEFTLDGNVTLIDENYAGVYQFEDVYERNLDEIIWRNIPPDEFTLGYDFISSRNCKKTGVVMHGDETTNQFNLEYVRFNHKYKENTIGKTTSIEGIINSSFTRAIINAEFINVKYYINQLHVEESEISFYDEKNNDRNLYIENVNVKGNSYFYVYTSTTMQSRYIRHYNIDAESGIEFSFEDDTVSSSGFKNLFDFDLRYSSYLLLSDSKPNGISMSGIRQRNYGQTSFNIPSTSALTTVDAIDVGADSSLTLNGISNGTYFGAITVRNSSSINITNANTLFNVTLDFSSNIFGATTFGIQNSEFKFTDLDLSTLVANEDNRTFNGLT